MAWTYALISILHKYDYILVYILISTVISVFQFYISTIISENSGAR